SAIEKGLTNTQLYDLDVGPAGTVYIATQDTGAFRKKNAKPWDFDVKADGTGDVLEVLAHPSDDSRLFIRNNNPELLISSKYGSTFTKSKGLPFGGWWNHLLVYVPSKKILYAGAAGQGIFKSTDDGKNFKPTNMGIQYLSPRCLAGLPGDATTLYVGTLDKGLYKTVDGAVSWQQVPTFPKTAVLSLLVAANGSQVFAGTASGVYLSQDGGKTWNPRNTGLPSRKVVSELTADPTNANSIYAGLGYYSWEGLYGGGVYRSQDNGKTWHSLLPQKDRYVNVTSIRFDPKEKSRIWVGTFGSGVVTLFKEN
ncbi:MAG: hypothetical protein GY757_10465, partial [bacterium]|nr:hypothetical protein [bacterium]